MKAHARRLGGWTDDDFRKDVGCSVGRAAYRTQLFLYLKACGRHELSTVNLWAGADAVTGVKPWLVRSRV
jgi:hypothetical protein